MYCSSCGAALPQQLSFCNRCGARLSSTKDGGRPGPGEKSAESVVWSIVGVTLSMLGIMIAVLALMKGFGLGTVAVVVFMSLMFLLLFGVDSILLWQLLRLRRLGKGVVGRASQSDGSDTKVLSAQPGHMLAEPRASVTEDATRLFEAAYEEREAK